MAWGGIDFTNRLELNVFAILVGHFGVKPISFTKHFGIDYFKFLKFGAFDPMLTHDTRLFIDPLLLPLSSSAEFSDQASDLFQKHFEQLFRLMAHSQSVNDPSWKAAAKLLKFPEIRYTCLGYGKSNTRGSSFGTDKEKVVLSIAANVASVGVKDPYILPLYSLLEKNIGADLISDMTTNVILPAICEYTLKVCNHFEVPLDEHKILGQPYSLPTNPFGTSR